MTKTLLGDDTMDIDGIELDSDDPLLESTASEFVKEITITRQELQQIFKSARKHRVKAYNDK
jgi:hypothetical protein